MRCLHFSDVVFEGNERLNDRRPYLDIRLLTGVSLYIMHTASVALLIYSVGSTEYARMQVYVIDKNDQ